MTDHNHHRENDSSERKTEREEDPPAQYPVEVLHSAFIDDESPTTAVVSAVSTVEGVESTELEPIHESVDPDALNTLLDGPVVVGEGDTIDVAFRYLGYWVRVRNDGRITILEPEE